MEENTDKKREFGPLIVAATAGLLLLITIISLFWGGGNKQDEIEDLTFVEEEIVERVLTPDEIEAQLYNLTDIDSVRVEHKAVKSGDSMSTILDSYGFSPIQIITMANNTKKVFDVRRMRSGDKYIAFIDLSINKLKYIIYNVNKTEYIKYTFAEEITAERIKRTVDKNIKTLHVNVSSSLWVSVVDAGGNPALVSAVEDIYQWTVDFYGISPGDSFSFIYEENKIDGSVVGTGNILAVCYNNGKNTKYAFRYESDGKAAYWDEEGKGLRRAFLKAPLNFSRISSKFTYRRLHPIDKVYRAHTGVDYAAPTGTPVRAIADGVVIEKAYQKGGGNYLKIKHYINNGEYKSGYLHLSRYGQGIQKGSKVTQGQVIGYVGSTGASTGPHLDFRIWKHDKPVDPLKISNAQVEPLSSDLMPTFKSDIQEYLDILKALEATGKSSLSDEERERLKEERAKKEREEQISTEPAHEI